MKDPMTPEWPFCTTGSGRLPREVEGPDAEADSFCDEEKPAINRMSDRRTAALFRKRFNGRIFPLGGVRLRIRIQADFPSHL